MSDYQMIPQSGTSLAPQILMERTGYRTAEVERLLPGGKASYRKWEELRLSVTGEPSEEEQRLWTLFLIPLKLRLRAHRLIDAVPDEILTVVVSELEQAIEYETRILEESNSGKVYLECESLLLPVKFLQD